MAGVRLVSVRRWSRVLGWSPPGPSDVERPVEAGDDGTQMNDGTQLTGGASDRSWLPTRRSRGRWRLAAVASTATALLLIATSVSYACGVGWRADGANLTWCLSDSLDGYPLMKDTAHWSAAHVANNTAMSTTAVSACSSSTDMRFVRADLGDGAWGETRAVDCNNANPPVCDKFNVIQDYSSQVTTLTNEHDPYSDGREENGELELNFKKTWCHEVGHVTSVDHHPAVFGNRYSYYDDSEPDRVTDCMVRGHIESAADWMRYNQHHKNDIASRY